MANELARKLRKQMTPQEVKLWARLRPLRDSHGHRFRRQVPLRGYIVDFACFSAKLIIEIDGGQHAQRVTACGMLFWSAEVLQSFASGI